MAKTQANIIRLATTKDMYVIAEMSRRFVEHGLPWRWKGARVYRHIQNPDSTVIVADHDGEITGFAIVGFAQTNAHINLLAVDESVRGAGIGASLIEWIKTSARVAGIGSVNLEVRRSNDGAIAFYERMGFEVIGLHRGYYEGKDDARLMSLRLISNDQERQRPPFK